MGFYHSLSINSGVFCLRGHQLYHQLKADWLRPSAFTYAKKLLIRGGQTVGIKYHICLGGD